MLSRLRNKPMQRDIMLSFDLQSVTVEQLESLCYSHGFAYAVDADRLCANLTTPRADEDVQIH